MTAGGGRLRVVDGPRPRPGAADVLVAPTRSLLSPGTERAVRALAAQGLVGKARARPDLVRQVVAKARAEGLGEAARAVRGRLDEELPLGYSSAGTVVAVGAAVAGLRVGQRVAAAGAGHAEVQRVAGLLAVALPDEVCDEDAAFGALGAVALNAVRAADVQPGSRLAVVGMGLLGRLVARVGAAAGASVVGIDVRPVALEGPDPVDLALLDEGAGTTGAVLDWSRGRGADAVVVAAADPTGDSVARAPALARDRGTVVVVGDAAVRAERRALYERELTLVVPRSYGPGRYELAYEAWGVDVPVGSERWTAGRNLEAFVDLLAGGRVDLGGLVAHRVPFADAPAAYDRLEDEPRPVAVQLVYEPAAAAATTSSPPAATTRPARLARPRLALVGAGTFVTRTLLPALTAAGFAPPVAIASRDGRSASRVAEQVGAGCRARAVDEVVGAADVDVVVVATTHDRHAELAVAALEAGQHVYCEKPLALDEDELAAVEAAWRASSRALLVGFNRRWSAAVRDVASIGSGPRVVDYRVSTGPLPADHWYADRVQGGRLLGEGCHFVDAAIALVGSPVVAVQAAGTAPHGVEALLATDVVVGLEHADGSLSSIVLASGGSPRTRKERVEVLGGGHTTVIDDFAAVGRDGRRRRVGEDGKGHVAMLRDLRGALARGDAEVGTERSLASTAVTLAAARSLLCGERVVLSSGRDEPA